MYTRLANRGWRTWEHLMKTVRLIFGNCFVVGPGATGSAAFTPSSIRASSCGRPSRRRGGDRKPPAGELQQRPERPLLVVTIRESASAPATARRSFSSRTPAQNPPVYRVNEPVTVLYDPRQPQHASIKSFAQVWMLPSSCAAWARCFRCWELGQWCGRASAIARNACCSRTGAASRRRSRACSGYLLQVAGKSPYRIVCQWLDPASHQVHIFHSANICSIPPTTFGKTIESWWIGQSAPLRRRDRIPAKGGLKPHALPLY